jgi:hypothetical protein
MAVCPSARSATTRRVTVWRSQPGGPCSPPQDGPVKTDWTQAPFVANCHDITSATATAMVAAQPGGGRAGAVAPTGSTTILLHPPQAAGQRPDMPVECNLPQYWETHCFCPLLYTRNNAQIYARMGPYSTCYYYTFPFPSYSFSVHIHLVLDTHMYNFVYCALLLLYDEWFTNSRGIWITYFFLCFSYR